MFDQEFWSEQLSWRELAVSCSSPKQLKEEELVGALRALRSGTMRENIEAVARDIEKEDGIQIALRCIKRLHKVSN
jgi:UDP:flavonoid glycosyltransferase YjiC (YdhE family)